MTCMSTNISLSSLQFRSVPYLEAVLLAFIYRDHRGIPNNILCKEEQELAAVYDNKSVAEQVSRLTEVTPVLLDCFLGYQ